MQILNELYQIVRRQKTNRELLYTRCTLVYSLCIVLFTAIIIVDVIGKLAGERRIVSEEGKRAC